MTSRYPDLNALLERFHAKDMEPELHARWCEGHVLALSAEVEHLRSAVEIDAAIEELTDSALGEDAPAPTAEEALASVGLGTDAPEKPAETVTDFIARERKCPICAEPVAKQDEHGILINHKDTCVLGSTHPDAERAGVPLREYLKSDAPKNGNGAHQEDLGAQLEKLRRAEEQAATHRRAAYEKELIDAGTDPEKAKQIAAKVKAYPLDVVCGFCQKPFAPEAIPEHVNTEHPKELAEALKKAPPKVDPFLNGGGYVMPGDSPLRHAGFLSTLAKYQKDGGGSDAVRALFDSFPVAQENLATALERKNLSHAERDALRWPNSGQVVFIAEDGRVRTDDPAQGPETIFVFGLEIPEVDRLALHESICASGKWIDVAWDTADPTQFRLVGRRAPLTTFLTLPEAAYYNIDVVRLQERAANLGWRDLVWDEVWVGGGRFHRLQGRKDGVFTPPPSPAPEARVFVAQDGASLTPPEGVPVEAQSLPTPEPPVEPTPLVP